MGEKYQTVVRYMYKYIFEVTLEKSLSAQPKVLVENLIHITNNAIIFKASSFSHTQPGVPETADANLITKS